MDEKPTEDKRPSAPQPASNIQSILKEIANKDATQKDETAKTPLDNLKNVLTAADTKAQQLQKTEEKIPSPSIKPITIRQITIVPKEETSASVSPSVNQILVDSEAVRKLDELIKAHRAGKS